MTTTLWHRVAALRIVLLLPAACVLLLAAADGLAEQARAPKRIGVVLFGYETQSEEVQAFARGLRDAGYVEGRDVIIDWRATDANPDRLSAVLAELVTAKVDVLVVESTAAALAAKRATTNIPIVMAFVADPVGSGIVQSLGRPGGNLTGLSNMSVDLAVKRMQLLTQAVPGARKIGVLWNPDTPWHQRVVEKLEAAAPALKVELAVVAAQTPAELGSAFAALSRAKVDALLLVDGPFSGLQGPAIMQLAMKARLPVAYAHRRLVAHGALMSYAPDAKDMFRRAAGYVDKILRGAKPADLPVQQPIKFELVVNLKTAKALGIKIPESIMLQANEVIK